jgi:hypothetical protein
MAQSPLSWEFQKRKKKKNELRTKQFLGTTTKFLGIFRSGAWDLSSPALIFICIRLIIIYKIYFPIHKTLNAHSNSSILTQFANQTKNST